MSFHIPLKTALDIVAPDRRVRQQWLEDPYYRRVFTPCNHVIELHNAEQWFSALEDMPNYGSNCVAHVAVRHANVVDVRFINTMGQTIPVEFTKTESNHFMLDLMKAIEHHGFRLSWFVNHKSPDQEVIGIMVTKR